MSTNSITFTFESQKPARWMGVVWFLMGVMTMLFPRPIASMSFTNEFLSSVQDSILFYGVLICFGAQATCCGILLMISYLSRSAYLIWALVIIPFILLDAYAYVAGIVTLQGALGDFGGNVIFLSASLYGASISSSSTTKAKKGKTAN